MRRTTLIYLAAGVFVLVISGATVAKVLHNSVFDDFKARGEHEAYTIEEARRRGIVVAELVSDPAEPEVDGRRVRFAEIWIEERSLKTHRWVWLPAENRIGGYRVSFTLAGESGGSDPDVIFRVIGAGGSVGGTWTVGHMIYHLEVDHPDLTRLQLSMAKADDEFRRAGFRFRRK